MRFLTLFSNMFNKRESLFALKDTPKCPTFLLKCPTHILCVIQLIILDSKRFSPGHPVIGTRHKYFQVEVYTLCFSSLVRD